MPGSFSLNLAMTGGTSACARAAAGARLSRATTNDNNRRMVRGPPESSRSRVRLGPGFAQGRLREGGMPYHPRHAPFVTLVEIVLSVSHEGHEGHEGTKPPHPRSLLWVRRLDFVHLRAF